MKVIIQDIDGCIIKSPSSMIKVGLWLDNCEAGLLLPGVQEKFEKWYFENNYIILLTARPEIYRKETENQLKNYGLFWDQLIMGIPHAPRHIVNDERSDKIPSAVAHILSKNEGLKNLEI